jgi:hypothetical protein
MNPGIVFVASCTGISPIDPLTSSANTMDSESGWLSLSRLSRTCTPSGFKSAWHAFCVNTSLAPSPARAAVAA